MDVRDEIDFRSLNHWLSLCHPMPTRRKVVAFQHTFSAEDVKALRRALLPQTMDDKWFGVLREGSLDFYRSWTGFHIHRLLLRNEGRGLVAHKLIVSRARSQYMNTDDAYDREVVAFLIDQMLSGQRA